MECFEKGNKSPCLNEVPVGGKYIWVKFTGFLLFFVDYVIIGCSESYHIQVGTAVNKIQHILKIMQHDLPHKSLYHFYST